MDNTMNQQPQANAPQNATNGCTPCQSQQPQQQPQAMQNATTTQNSANMQNNATPQAVVGIFSSLSAAEQCVTQLRNSGFTTEEINIISKGNAKETTYGNDSIMDGTMTGGAIGGIGGLLLSAGALTIPGIGPIIAAGPLAATIAGAVGGGITGGLVDWGIPAAKSEEYTNEVSSGNTLAVLKSTQDKVAQAVQILTANGAMNVETHAAK